MKGTCFGEVDGPPVTPQSGARVLPSSTRTLRVTGPILPGTQGLNCERAVEQFKEEYDRRYARFLRTGSRLE